MPSLKILYTNFLHLIVGNQPLADPVVHWLDTFLKINTHQFFLSLKFQLFKKRYK